MTRDTVAGERPRCSANNFKLTDRAGVFPRGGDDATVFARIMGCFVGVVWHTELGPASSEVEISAMFIGQMPCPVTSGGKTNRFSTG